MTSNHLLKKMNQNQRQPVSKLRKWKNRANQKSKKQTALPSPFRSRHSSCLRLNPTSIAQQPWRKSDQKRIIHRSPTPVKLNHSTWQRVMPVKVIQMIVIYYQLSHELNAMIKQKRSPQRAATPKQRKKRANLASIKARRHWLLISHPTMTIRCCFNSPHSPPRRLCQCRSFWRSSLAPRNRLLQHTTPSSCSTTMTNSCPRHRLLRLSSPTGTRSRPTHCFTIWPCSHNQVTTSFQQQQSCSFQTLN